MTDITEKASSVFAFTGRAAAPAGSRYKAGRRYELIVFVSEPVLDAAREIFRRTLQRAGWTAPEIQDVVQVDHKLRLARLKQLNLGEAVAAAVRDGSAIVVFDGNEESAAG